MRIRPLVVLLVLAADPIPGWSQPDTTVESATLRALAESAARNPSAQADFWARLERTGSPLVEAVPGDTTSSLVTFVWQGDGSARGVAVITPFSLIDVELGRMRRLPATHLWYRSFRMRDDAVMLYRFGPDDSMVPFTEEPNLRQRMSGWQPDPFNPRGFTYRDGSRASLLKLGPGEDLTAPVARHGAVVDDTVPDPARSAAQPVTIYTPPGYDPDSGNHSLLVLMDGDSYLQLMDIASLLDRLYTRDRIRSAVVILIPPTRAARTDQYNCNPAWSRFLAETLVPWVEARYRTSSRPEDRVVGGFSLGGLAAACAAVDFPDVFGNVLAQSGSFYRSPDPHRPEALARRLAGMPSLPIRWSLQVGLLETAPIPSRDPSMLTATRHLRDVLIAKGNPIDYREFFGGHEHVAWATLLPEALSFLLQR